MTDDPRSVWMTATIRIQCGAVFECAIQPGEPYYRTRLGLLRCKKHALPSVSYVEPTPIQPRPTKTVDPAATQPFASVAAHAKKLIETLPDDYKAKAAGYDD